MSLACDAENKQFTLEIENDSRIKDFIKHEDSNSANCLLIDEEKTQIFQNTVDSANFGVEECRICGKTFNRREFQQHYEQHFIKCIVCLAVFPHKTALDDHSKEVHGATPEKIKVCLNL